MKYENIKTIEGLEDELDKDLAWRKKEITSLNFLIAEAKEDHHKEILTKSAIMIFYSHWEGHIKLCAKSYLSFINAQELSCGKIQDIFFQLTLAERFKNNFSIQKKDHQKNLINFFKERDEHHFNVDVQKLITTANLNYEVLIDIMECLGVESEFFTTKQNLLNKIIVKFRHMVAHGDLLPLKVAMDAYKQIKEYLLEMIEKFNALIKESAEKSNYLLKELII